MDCASEVNFQFFLPHTSDFTDIPERSDAVWNWILSHPKKPIGQTVWTLYTFLVLSEAGFKCSLARHLPRQGIVISHRDFLPDTIRPRDKLFLVCLKADRKAHSWAQIHVVQNPADPLCDQPVGMGVFPVLHWPQPSLLPRDPRRGEHVERLGFFGLPINVEPALREDRWSDLLASLGCQWDVVPIEGWHDYSQIDVTVSIRRYGDAHITESPMHSSLVKPPTKLLNSWLAGVPAIVGDESAYHAIRRSELDFLVASSEQELLASIRLLKSNPSLYSDMVANGLERGVEFDKTAITKQWMHLLGNKVAPIYEDWISQPSLRRTANSWMPYIEAMSQSYMRRSRRWIRGVLLRSQQTHRNV